MWVNLLTKNKGLHCTRRVSSDYLHSGATENQEERYEDCSVGFEAENGRTQEQDQDLVAKELVQSPLEKYQDQCAKFEVLALELLKIYIYCFSVHFIGQLVTKV